MKGEWKEGEREQREAHSGIDDIVVDKIMNVVLAFSFTPRPKE